MTKGGLLKLLIGFGFLFLSLLFSGGIILALLFSNSAKTDVSADPDLQIAPTDYVIWAGAAIVFAIAAFYLLRDKK